MLPNQVDVFSLWTHQRLVPSEAADIPLIRDYILSLMIVGLSISALRGYLAVISAFHPPSYGYLIFKHPRNSRFWKDLIRIFLPIKKPTLNGT